MTKKILIFLLKLVATDVEVIKKKKRGRPYGSRDSKPRVRRRKKVIA
tara:strand:+ start:1532 stop:1672 length:141 start_codon:yes stop_codon:yes gene_type:complete